LDWSQLPILLFDEEEGGSIGAFRWSYRPPGEMFFEEGFEFFLFKLG